MLDTIFNHRSIRKFSNTQIPPDLLEEILLAGTRASTTGNMQVYSMVVTTGKELKEKLWAVHFKQDMVKEAPVLITFCADFNRFTQWCLQRKASPGYDNFLSFFTAAIDALLVAQNVALAAESHDLGICYLGTTTYMAAEIVAILDLPEYVVPVTTLAVGYPAENPDRTDRLPLDAMIHRETYKKYSPARLDEIYTEKESSALTAQLLRENNKETLAQIFTDKRYTRQDNIKFSRAFLKVIESQGFMNNFE
jgi:nitroreductase